MYIIQEQSIFDPDLDMLTEVLAVFDRHLAAILEGWEDASEADSLGYFDRAEHITGLGFVACQAYLTATYGFANVKKSDALSMGPRHASGQTIAQAINHAANFWKHHDEWHLDKSLAQQDRIMRAFDSIGFPVDLDYPLSGVLTELAVPGPAAFAPLLPKLDQWREEVRQR